MSDRLQELLRQRAAIHAHLAWLDREIVAQASAPVSAALTPSTTSPVESASDPSSPASGSLPDTNPEIILAGYRQDTTNLRTDLRQGCLLYFFAALALVVLAFASFYFLNRLAHRYTDAVPSAPSSTRRANEDSAR